MKIISGKELCKILDKKDWVLKKVTESHHIYIKEGMKERISIPVRQNKPLKIGILKHIMKLAMVEESEL